MHGLPGYDSRTRAQCPPDAQDLLQAEGSSSIPQAALPSHCPGTPWKRPSAPRCCVSVTWTEVIGAATAFLYELNLGFESGSPGAELARPPVITSAAPTGAIKGSGEQGKAGSRELASTVPAWPTAGWPDARLWSLDGHWSPHLFVSFFPAFTPNQRGTKRPGSNATFLPFFSSIQIWEAPEICGKATPQRFSNDFSIAVVWSFCLNSR